MAVPTLGSTPTTIDLAEAVTNWGGDTFSLEPDIKVQGSNSVACVMTASGNNDAYVTGTWDFSGTGLGDQHLRLWFNITFIGNLSATNAIQIFLYDGTNTAYYYWDKAADYTGGWAQAVIYTGDTPDSGTVTKSSVTRIGMRFSTASKPRNVPANCWFDAWRYGDGCYATGGGSDDKISLDTIAAVDLTNAYGIVTKEVNGSLSLRGDLQIGNGATTTWFEMNNEEAFFVEEQVNVGLYKFSGNGAGCRIDIADATFKAAGTAAKDAFDFDSSETNLLTFSMVDTKLTRADAVTFKSGQTVTGCIFNGCGQITHAGADMDNGVVKGYEGTADTSALIYNVNADPDGEMDGMAFTRGTAATHAVEFGTTSPLTMTIRDEDFSGYTNTIGSTSAPVHVKRTVGTVTINIPGCTGITASGYKSDGATVVIQDTVDLEVNGVSEGAQCSLITTSTTTYPSPPETDGITILDGYADTTGKVTASYAYSAPQPVIVTARFRGQVAAVLQYDLSLTAYTDQTNAARDRSTSKDVDLYPATSAIGDIAYIGGLTQFSRIYAKVGTAGGGLVIVYEYWNGAWTTLPSVSSKPTDFHLLKTAANGEINFPAPTDWATTTIDSKGPFYYIRLRLTTAASPEPVLDWLELNAPMYRDYEAGKTVLGAFTDTAIWQLDPQGG